MYTHIEVQPFFDTAQETDDDIELPVDTGVDLSGLEHGAKPLGMFEFSNYHGHPYDGPDTVDIYQDNLHVTTGPEPTSCEVFGLKGE